MLKGPGENFDFYQAALNVLTYRQQLIASNIANADTPNYKAVDLDFGRAMQLALGGQQGIGMQRTASGHLSGFRGSALDSAVMYRVPAQASIDGNTVNTEVENAQFTENAIRYQFMLDRLSSQIKNLQTAIQGQ